MTGSLDLCSTAKLNLCFLRQSSYTADSKWKCSAVVFNAFLACGMSCSMKNVVSGHVNKIKMRFSLRDVFLRKTILSSFSFI